MRLAMRTQTIHRLSGRIAVIFSLIALVTVLLGYTKPRGTVEADEGAGAHVFQLSIVALAPTILVFLITTDWKRPRQGALPLVLCASALGLAFTALYCLEHFWFTRH